jgi:hypothetical protein
LALCRKLLLNAFFSWAFGASVLLLLVRTLGVLVWAVQMLLLLLLLRRRAMLLLLS